MPKLDRPRIVVDFNEMVEQDVVLLSRDDWREDSSGIIVRLRDGLRVFLYMSDASESGEPANLLATGVVEQNDAKDWSSAVKWRCRIDSWEEV
jgi:hypothetical protein